MPERAEPQETSYHFKECALCPLLIFDARLPSPCCLLSDSRSVQAAGHCAWITSNPPAGWGPLCSNEERYKFSLVMECPRTYLLSGTSLPSHCAIGWVCR